MAGSWPPHAPDTLVVRLERGPERDLALAELIDILVYAPRQLFTAHAEEILAALEARCPNEAQGSDLGLACQRGKTSFAPGFLGGFGRGFGVSCRCGGGLSHGPAVCDEISLAFTELVEEAGDPGMHLLRGAVLPVDPT